jgi:hypothetical protein
MHFTTFLFSGTRSSPPQLGQTAGMNSNVWLMGGEVTFNCVISGPEETIIGVPHLEQYLLLDSDGSPQFGQNDVGIQDILSFTLV